jgi:hypothetical protein
MYDDKVAARIIEQITEFYVPGNDVAAIIEKACGRYVRGKHKGKLRGWATVVFCTEGGWKKDGPGYHNGRVYYPGTVVRITISDYSGKTYLDMQS